MSTLAIIEHLEKVPYLLSLFLPVALFFFSGLVLAWWVWYQDAERLRDALGENERLSGEFSAISKDEKDLGSRFSGLFKKRQKHWQSKLSKQEDQLADLDRSFGDFKEQSSNEFQELEEKRSRLKSQLTDREEKLGSLEGDLSKNASALGLLQTQIDGGQGEMDELRRDLDQCSATLGDRDQELEELRSQLSAQAAESDESAELKAQIADLQGQLVEQDKTAAELARLRDEPSLGSEMKAAPAPVIPDLEDSAEPPSPASFFTGEPVRVDPEYGVLFTDEPMRIDDLKRIKGVARVLEAKLHDIGLYRFKQIALWDDEQVAAFSEKLSFPGRVERDEWVAQAKAFHEEEYGQA